ncbi:PIN domain-containing protein [Arenimonas composti]|uniref:PIN domain-containing protein n=1 Tax=Arenimonas composti TaxID=370776 RepID=UPI001FE19904|nr:PIN domain-containing protein [Arenimonas composti]
MIDYENVQPAALAALEKEHFKILVFVGASQTKVNYEIADSLQRLGPKASYIKISGNGPNALDFHIAYYIGQLAAADKDGFFHIISKDTGFDPLIAHLKTKKIYACRSRDVSDMPIVKAANSKSPTEKIEVIVANLKQRGPSKPRTVKTLTSTISSLFQKALPEEELGALLKSLQKQGYVAVNGTKVSYSLPE